MVQRTIQSLYKQYYKRSGSFKLPKTFINKPKFLVKIRKSELYEAHRSAQAQVLKNDRNERRKPK